MQALPAQRKCTLRTKQILNMVFGTLDVLRAADYVLVFEATKIHAPSPQPARALQLWVVLQFVGAAVLSPVLSKVPICCNGNAAESAEVLFGLDPSSFGVSRVASASDLSAAHANQSLHRVFSRLLCDLPERSPVNGRAYVWHLLLFLVSDGLQVMIEALFRNSACRQCSVQLFAMHLNEVFAQTCTLTAASKDARPCFHAPEVLVPVAIGHSPNVVVTGPRLAQFCV